MASTASPVCMNTNLQSSFMYSSYSLPQDSNVDVEHPGSFSRRPGRDLGGLLVSLFEDGVGWAQASGEGWCAPSSLDSASSSSSASASLEPSSLPAMGRPVVVVALKVLNNSSSSSVYVKVQMQVVVEPSSLRTTENNSQTPPPPQQQQQQQQQQFFCSSMAEYDGNPHNPRALLKSKKQATYRSSLVLRYQTKLNRDAARHFMRVSQRNLRERRMELAGRVWARLLFARPFRELAADATVRALWRKGLPPAARGAVWPLAVGNALNITGTLYEVVKQRAWEVLQEHGTPLSASATSPRDVRSVSAVSCPSPGDTARDAAAAVTAVAAAATAASDGADEYRSPPPPSSSHRRPTDSTPSPSPSQGWLRGRESSIKLLLIDAPRTHLGPGRSLFAVGAPLHESLLSVLGAYAFYRPDVGYVQGMSYLAGMLLLYCRDEATAFLCLANLLNRAPYPALLRMESSLLSRKLELFERALNEQLPALASHLSELGCAPDLYLIEWLFTLFAKSHNLEVAGRVWDCFLLEGESFLLRTAIATLRLLSDEILACGELGAVLRILKRSTRALSEQELFDMVQATPISQSVAKMAELASVEYFTPRVVGT